MMPASPASAPDTAKVNSTSRSELKPAKRAALGRRADHADLEALDGAPEHHGRQHHHDQRDDGAGMHAAAFEQSRHGGDRIE